jgi:hypothetical protein
MMAAVNNEIFATGIPRKINDVRGEGQIVTI